MRLALLSAAAFCAAGTASAGEWADACKARLEADGRDTSGCACLEAKITEKPSLEQEFLALAEIADPASRYASASADAKAAMDSCTRK